MTASTSLLLLYLIAAPPRPTLPPADSGGPPEPRLLTLPLSSAVGQAVRSNADLRRAGIDVKIALQSVKQARSTLDGALTAAVSYSGSKSTAVPGSFFNTLRTDIFSYQIGFSQPLPTGGKVSLTLGSGLSRQLTSIAFSDTAPPEERDVNAWESSLKLAVTHPLLKGVGLEVGLAPLRQARLRRDAARWAVLARARAVLRDILKSYLGIVGAQEGARVTKSALKLAKRDLKRAELLVETGRLPETELTAYQVQVAQRQRELVEARTVWLTRSMDLLHLIGSPKAGQALLLEASLDKLPLRRDVPSATHAREQALKTSADLAAAKRLLRVAYISKKVARRNRLPSLDFSGSIGPTGQSDDPGKSYANMFKFKGLSWSVGLTFSYLVGNRAARAASATASLEIKRQQVTIAELRRTLAMQASRIVALLGQQHKLLQASEAEARLAKIRLANERRKLAYGKSNLFMIQQLENALLGAQYKVLSARIAKLSSRADLAALTGELLPDLGVRVKKGRIATTGR